jgi:hypothetical protein
MTEKKDPRDMDMAELLAAAERMPAHIREWFDERTAILETEAGFATDDAVRTAFILARAEYKQRLASRKQIDAALGLLAEAAHEFDATVGRFRLHGEPGPSGTIVRVGLATKEAP